MATNLVQPLDPALAQLYCGICTANGVPDMMLVREMHLLKCNLGHQYQSVGEAVARGSTMVPLPLNERPPLTSVKIALWVNPKVKEILETKYRGRLIATTDVLLSSLADGNVMILSGEDVAKLKKRGIRNGNEMVAALESMDQTARERDDAMRQIERFQEVLKAAGV